MELSGAGETGFERGCVRGWKRRKSLGESVGGARLRHRLSRGREIEKDCRG